MNENDPAPSAPFRRNQRGPVDQPRPGFGGEVQIRLGQDLARHRDVTGDGEPREWAFRRERSELCGLLPRERAADRASAAVAEPHRQQLVALLGEMRPGETQQQPAGFDPLADSRLFCRRIRSGIGKHQHRELAPEKIRRAAAAQFGERTERPLEIIVFSEQRLPFGVGRRDDPDRAPAPPLVDQQHRAGGLIAFDLDPGHAVAQLAGHGQTKLGTLCSRLDCRCLPRDQAAVVPARPHLNKTRHRRRQRAQHNPDVVCLGVPSSQHDRGVRGLRRQISQTPPLDELSCQRLIPAIIRDAVAEPDGGIGFGQGECFEASECAPPVDGPRLGHQCLNRRPRIRCAHRAQRG